MPNSIFTRSLPCILASKIHWNSYFIQDAIQDTIFFHFIRFYVPNFGTPFKIQWASKWHPKSTQWCHQLAEFLVGDWTFLDFETDWCCRGCPITWGTFLTTCYGFQNPFAFSFYGSGNKFRQTVKHQTQCKIPAENWQRTSKTCKNERSPRNCPGHFAIFETTSAATNRKL